MKVYKVIMDGQVVRSYTSEDLDDPVKLVDYIQLGKVAERLGKVCKYELVK